MKRLMIVAACVALSATACAGGRLAPTNEVCARVTEWNGTAYVDTYKFFPADSGIPSSSIVPVGCSR